MAERKKVKSPTPRPTSKKVSKVATVGPRDEGKTAERKTSERPTEEKKAEVKAWNYKILSIDGGGIRGLIPLYILRELQSRTEKSTHDLFNMFAGTSTGGIIALGLANINPKTNALYTVDDLINIYEKDGPEIFIRREGRFTKYFQERGYWVMFVALITVLLSAVNGFDVRKLVNLLFFKVFCSLAFSKLATMLYQSRSQGVSAEVGKSVQTALKEGLRGVVFTLAVFYPLKQWEFYFVGKLFYEIPFRGPIIFSLIGAGFCWYENRSAIIGIAEGAWIFALTAILIYVEGDLLSFVGIVLSYILLRFIALPYADQITSSRYASPLRLYQEYFGTAPLSASSKDVLVTAVTDEDIKITTFTKSGTPAVEVAHAAGATSAAPTYFPKVQIGQVWYRDGGIKVNNPTYQAVKDAKTRGVNLNDVYILSLGTGTPLVQPAQKGAKTSLWLVYWLKTLWNQFFEGHSDDSLLRDWFEHQYARVQITMDKEIGLDAISPTDIDKMKALAADHLKSNAKEFTRIVETLKR